MGNSRQAPTVARAASVWWDLWTLPSSSFPSLLLILFLGLRVFSLRSWIWGLLISPLLWFLLFKNIPLQFSSSLFWSWTEQVCFNEQKHWSFFFFFKVLFSEWLTGSIIFCLPSAWNIKEPSNDLFSSPAGLAQSHSLFLPPYPPPLLLPQASENHPIYY